MMYIATFYSHFGAIRYKKFCDGKGWPAKVMPVPRSLSSSCGTCVRYEGDGNLPSPIPDEVEQIVSETADGAYTPLFRAENG